MRQSRDSPIELKIARLGSTAAAAFCPAVAAGTASKVETIGRSIGQIPQSPSNLFRLSQADMKNEQEAAHISDVYQKSSQHALGNGSGRRRLRAAAVAAVSSSPSPSDIDELCTMMENSHFGLHQLFPERERARNIIRSARSCSKSIAFGFNSAISPCKAFVIPSAAAASAVAGNFIMWIQSIIGHINYRSC